MSGDTANETKNALMVLPVTAGSTMQFGNPKTTARIDGSNSIAPVSVSGKALHANGNKITRYGVSVFDLITGAYYRCPALGSAKNDAADRWISPVLYDARSCIAGEPLLFDRYYTRALSKERAIITLLSRMQNVIAESLFSRVTENTVGVSKADIEWAIGDYMYNGAGSVDALYGDLYRMLVGRGTLVDASLRHVNAYNVLQSISQAPEFAETVARVKGNAALAAVAARELLEKLLDSQASMQAVCAMLAGDFDMDSDSDSDGGQNEGEGKPVKQSDINTLSKSAGRTLGKDGANVKALSSYDAQSETEAQDMCGQLAGKGFVDPSHDIATLQQALKVTRDLFAGADNTAAAAMYHSTSYRNSRKPDVDSTARELFKILGRVEGYFSEAVASSRHGDGDIVDISVGSNIQNMIASEYAAFAIDELSILWDVKFLNGELLETHRIGVDDNSGGPVIIMLDNSGSMDGRVRLGNENYSCLAVAKAFALALTKYSRKWGRDVAVIPFNDGIVESSAMYIRGTAITPSKIKAQIDATFSIDCAGGTSFTRTLASLAPVLKKSKFDFSNADVIYFSDGCGDVPSTPRKNEYDANYNAFMKSYTKAREALGDARLFGFFIAGSKQQAADVEKNNAAMFDHCVGADSADMATGVKRLFQSIVEHSFYRATVDYVEGSGEQEEA